MTVTASSLSEAIQIAKQGGDCMVKCPAHADRQASLHVKAGEKHPVVMTCHAGCTVEDILREGGVDQSEILAEAAERNALPITAHCLVLGGSEDRVADNVWTPVRSAGKFLTATHCYQYLDEQGNVLYEVLRVALPDGGKSFRQRQPDSTGPRGWCWNMEGVRRILYRLPEVLQAKAEGRVIWLVEGEKDAETLRSLGEVATTAPMGAGKWQDEYTAMLAGAQVRIIADKDTPGRNHARRVKEQLELAGCAVTLHEAAGDNKDVSDHVAAGLTLADLIETAPEQQAERPSYGIDILDAVTRKLPENSFVIPGVIARGDRMILTGYEGHGKSTFCKQWAIQVAAGIHPWTGVEMEPRRVLYLDAENHPDQSQEDWAHLLGLARAHGREVERGMLTLLEEWDADLDLTGQDGEDYLNERMHAFKPELFIVGPLYNLSEKDLGEHAVVARLKRAINNARALYGSAVLMEHHAPHKQPGDPVRSLRPYGSSTFLKWPEFGYGLKPMTTPEDPDKDAQLVGVYQFVQTRFNRVRKRYFPSHLRWGREDSIEWPWMECMVDGDGQVYG